MRCILFDIFTVAVDWKSIWPNETLFKEIFLPLQMGDLIELYNILPQFAVVLQQAVCESSGEAIILSGRGKEDCWIS